MRNKAKNTEKYQQYLVSLKNNRKRSASTMAKSYSNSKKKLTKNTACYKKVESKLKSGELTGNELPKDVWETDECYQEWPLARFRTMWHRQKAILGINVRDDDDEDNTNIADAIASSGVAAATCNTIFPNPAAVAKAKIDKKPPTQLKAPPPIPNCPDSGPGLLAGMFGVAPFDKNPIVEEETKSENLPWVPYNVSGIVKDTAAIRPNFFVVAQLPSGVDPDTVVPKMIDEGNKFSLKCPIASALTDPKILSYGLDDVDGIDKKVKVQESIEEKVKEMCGGVKKQLWQEFILETPFKCDFDFVNNQPIDYYGTVFLYVQMQATRTDEWNVKNKVNKIKRFSAEGEVESTKKMKSI